MKTVKSTTQHLVLLCNRQRPPGSRKPSCGHHGADALRDWLKDAMKAEGLWGDAARVAPVDCLDVCPNAGVVVAFDGGATLYLVDPETEREEVLAEIRRRVHANFAEPA